MKSFSVSADQSVARNSNADNEGVFPFWQRLDLIFGLALVVVYILMGLILTPQYGQSIDESQRISYASHSLDAYRGTLAFNLQDEKGPFYGMLAEIGTKVLRIFLPQWSFIVRWHFMTFLAFITGVYFFYRFCRRLIEPAPAMTATLLFSTQPLLWGHAFINPKDIPFMAFFLASVTLGLEMVDEFQARNSLPRAEAPLRKRLAALPAVVAKDWSSSSRRSRGLLAGLVLCLAALPLSFKLAQAGIARLVSRAYAASPSSGVGRLFQKVAQHAHQTPAQIYIVKAQTLYSWLAVLAGIVLVLALMWVIWKMFPSSAGRWLSFVFQPRVLLAGCFLGAASDIRTLGPAAGLLVGLYFLVKAGRRALPTVLVYLGIGALTIYFFWPYLWTAPLNNYRASLLQAADYHFWLGDNLFAGKTYSSANTPASYLPTLFGLQFTETALALILVGLIAAIILLVKKPTLRLDVLLAGAWAVAPVAAAIYLHSRVYNNFRQFLFVVPPLFFLAGLALQALWERLKHRPLIFAGLALLALLPGLYWDVQLHPYQYIYYNSLAGGVSGAFHNYENDYWLVSYREAMGYINQVAPQGATVSIEGTISTALAYPRSDIKIFQFGKARDEDEPQDSRVDYVILSTGRNADQRIYPDSRIIYQVSRDGAVLCVVKKINPGDRVKLR